MIEIVLLRVSPDSQYLQLRVTCPQTYEFNGITITKYDIATHNWEETSHDASAVIPSGQYELTLSFAMSIFSADPTDVTMYKVWFQAVPLDGGTDAPITATGICSNINFVYANLLDLVLAFTNCCITEQQYDTLDRNHMILYAHQEAMRLGREVEAMFFYDIIWNLFVSCGPTTRQSNVINKPCNCDG